MHDSKFYKKVEVVKLNFQTEVQRKLGHGDTVFRGMGDISIHIKRIF